MRLGKILNVKDDFKELIKTLTPQFYQFAFVMVPDDLQAQQIVIDATSSFLYQEGALLEYLHLDGQGSQRIKLDRLYKGLLPYIYDLAMKRFFQLEGQLMKSLQVEGDKAHFYQLEVAARALCYLKVKKNISYH